MFISMEKIIGLELELKCWFIIVILVKNILDLGLEIEFERAEAAQMLLILERQGDVGLFLYLYWPFVLAGLFLIVFASLIGVRMYKKFSIERQIKNFNVEEANIRK